MKKIKSIMIMALICVVSLSMASCGKKEDPLVKLNKALKANSDITKIDAKITGEISMNSAGQKVDFLIDFDLKGSDLSFKEATSKAMIALKGSMKIKEPYEMEMPLEVYIKEGTIYTKMLGQTSKETFSDDFKNILMLGAQEPEDSGDVITKENTKSVKYEGKYIAVDLEGDDFLAGMEAARPGMTDAMKVKACKIKFEFDDSDRLKSVQYLFDAVIAGDAQGDAFKMKLDIKFNKVDDKLKVEFPSDLADY
ncbi:MAG: hypothetical protein SOW90_00060 [Gallibacter sp.]|nr:hypothetical protein [Gallibacter sp.]